jgi:DNA-binding MarR family transcriptional regulator
MSSPLRNELLAQLVHEAHLLGGRLVVAHQGRADALGLNPTDLLCLELIDNEGPATAGRLAELLQLTTGAVTGVLDRLERAGFVRRERDPDDRRRVLVLIAPERQRELAQLLDPLGMAIDQVTEAWPEEDLRRALDFCASLHPALAVESARLRAGGPRAAQVETATVQSVPLGEAREARLDVSAGLVQVTIEVDPDLPELARAAFADSPPTLDLVGNTLRVRAKGWSLFRGWTGPGRLILNGAVRWTVALRGGMSQIKADLRKLDLAGLELGGGASHVDVSLPVPMGTVRVDVGGGASSFTLDRPPAVAVRVRASAGVSSFQIDSSMFGSLGSTHWQSSDFDSSPNRYDVTLGGGADHLVITTR